MKLITTLTIGLACWGLAAYTAYDDVFAYYAKAPIFGQLPILRPWAEAPVNHMHFWIAGAFFVAGVVGLSLATRIIHRRLARFGAKIDQWVDS